MNFNLDRDIVFFDLESTGLNVVRDRIIQIAMVKYHKGGQSPAELSMLINPGIPISEEAFRVHGIKPQDLSNKPVFSQVGQKIYDFIGDADLAGFSSNRFDIPLLMEEFDRIGIDFNVDQRRTIDVQRIFYRMEPRTLSAALKFYTGKKMEDAHNAMADVKATIEILKGQLSMYEGVDLEDENGNIIPNPVKNDIAALDAFSNDLNTIDATQRLKKNEQGEIVFNFGKYINQPVAQVFAADKNYYNWILNKEFSSQVKKIVKKIYKENEK